MLPGEVKEQWRQWVNQVPVIGFTSGKYDLNKVKEYFVKEISYNKGDKCNEDVFAAKKENDYMFPYKWLDSYEKLSHVSPVSHKGFYSSLKPSITRDE